MKSGTGFSFPCRELKVEETHNFLPFIAWIILIHRLICLFSEVICLSRGGDQVEQDADMLLSFSDRHKCAGHDTHMLFVKRPVLKKAVVAKDAGKELVFRRLVMLLLAVQDTPHTISLLSAKVSARTDCLGSITFFFYYFSMAAQLHVRQTRHWRRLIFHLVSQILVWGRHAERLKWRGMIYLSRVSVRPAFCRNAIDGTKTRRRPICISMRLRPFGWLPRRSTDNTVTLPIPFNFCLLRVHIAVWPTDSLLAAIVPHNVEEMSGSLKFVVRSFYNENTTCHVMAFWSSL